MLKGKRWLLRLFVPLIITSILILVPILALPSFKIEGTKPLSIIFAAVEVRQQPTNNEILEMQSLELVYTDSPTVESWEFGSARDGAVVLGYYINTTNLQVDRFWIQNDSDGTIQMWVEEGGEITFEMNSVSNSGYMEKKINGFKFQRMPATDPEDPDSVRYMPNTTIGFRNL